MTANALRNIVTEAVSLDREINEKSERLKDLKALLVAEAKTRKEELAPAEGGGTRWSSEGNDGCIARVNFPSPTLKSKIDSEGKVIGKIKALTGNLFGKLFAPSVTYRPVPGFREEAVSLLPKSEANKLIKLCENASTPRVSFETTDRVTD